MLTAGTDYVDGFAAPLELGDVFRLTGLKNAKRYNDCLGRIDGPYDTHHCRYPVRINGHGKVVRVRRPNIIKLAKLPVTLHVDTDLPSWHKKIPITMTEVHTVGDLKQEFWRLFEYSPPEFQTIKVVRAMFTDSASCSRWIEAINITIKRSRRNMDILQSRVADMFQQRRFVDSEPIAKAWTRAVRTTQHLETQLDQLTQRAGRERVETPSDDTPLASLFLWKTDKVWAEIFPQTIHDKT